MADYTQAESTVLALTALTHPDSIIGAAVDVAGYLSGEITVWFANTETTANATGAKVAVQGSTRATGNDWDDIVRWIGSTTAAETEELSDAGGEPEAETVLAVASTTNLAVGDLIYVQDDDTLAQSEFHEIIKVATNTSVEIADGLAYAKVQNDTIFDQADRQSIVFDCSGLKRVRVVVIHESATGSNMAVKALGTFASAIE